MEILRAFRFISPGAMGDNEPVSVPNGPGPNTMRREPGLRQPNFNEAAPFRMGKVAIFPDRNLIRREGRNTKLRPKTMKVLLYLASRHGSVVSREALIESIWEGNTYVGGRGVTDAIWQLRKSLGDLPDHPSYIETIPKTGYRLLAEVEALEAVGSFSLEPSAHSEQYGPGRPRTLLRTWPLLPHSNGFKVLWLALPLALATVLIWRTFPGRNPAFLSQPPAHPTPLTHFPGAELAPAVSADGRILAYAGGPEPAHTDIFIQSLQEPGTEPVAVTQTEEQESCPAWSPDGRRLAFFRRLDQGRVIVVHHLRNGREQRIPSWPIYEDSGLQWSPDGAKLLFSAHDREKQRGGLHVLDMHSLEESALTRNQGAFCDHRGRWSPDGNRLAFIRVVAFGKTRLFLYEQGHERAITPDNWNVRLFDWKPDGKSLLALSPELGNNPIEIECSSGAIRYLKMDLAQVTGMCTAKDNTLFYSQQKSGRFLYALSLEPEHGDQPPRPLVRSFGWDHSPSYCPETGTLAFISNRSGHNEIWLANIDGSEQRRLTFLERQVFVPAWSPDGTLIAFVTWVGEVDRYHLWLCQMGDTSVTALTTGDMNYAGIPTWSRDGRTLYIGRTRDNIWEMVAIDLERKHIRVVTENVYIAKESHDGKWLYFPRIGMQGLWRLPTRDGSGPAELVIAENTLETQWDLAEDGIFFISRSGAEIRLGFHRFRTGEVERLRTLPDTFSWNKNLCYAADVNVLVYGGSEPPQADIFRVSLK